MSSRTAVIAVVALFAGLMLLFQSVYVVDQTEKAIVLELGKPKGGVIGPGLHAKLPFVQNVVFFDARLLDYDAQAAEILTKDKKTLVMDNYSKWRITDPLKFYQTVRTVARAQARLDDIIYSQLRVALGNFTLIEIVSTKRDDIMELVTNASDAQVAEFGISVVDVRIKRADLPPENERAIFGRMRAERERQAKQYRSEGREEAAKIRAATDRERTVILAEAERQAEMLRGEGDAMAARIYAEAYTKNPEFYAFTRSLDAYRKSFEGNSRLLLTTDSPFLKYFQ